MKKIQRLLSLVLVALSLGVLSLSGLVGAQSTNQNKVTGANGLQVAPVRFPPDNSQFVIKPGTTVAMPSPGIAVTNVTKTNMEVQAVVNDFTVAPGNETGQPDLILDPNQFAPSHSLKRFIQPIPNFTLGPGETKNITVTFTVPANAAGGGYYGAVRFVPVTGPNGNSNVVLSASVGTLILVKVPGNIVDQLSISSFEVRQFDPKKEDGTKVGGSSLFTKKDHLNAAVRFQNTGNIQEQPFGKVILKKGGKTLQTIEINNTTNRGNVLPQSIRMFSVPLDKVGSWGKYTVEGNFGYANGQTLSAKTTFYVVPLILVISVIAGIILLLLLIFGLPRAIRAYNRRVISKARR